MFVYKKHKLTTYKEKNIQYKLKDLTKGLNTTHNI